MTEKKTEALKALEEIHPGNMTPIAEEAWNKAITAIREALAEQPAQQDSTCNKKLREQGKAYPRTCKKCGLGPCIADRVQPTPVAKPHEQQEPVACKTLCELCVKRGYHFCANAAQTTPIPSPPASKPLTDEEILAANYPDGEENGPTIAAPNFELICFARQIEAKLKEKNT